MGGVHGAHLDGGGVEGRSCGGDPIDQNLFDGQKLRMSLKLRDAVGDGRVKGHEERQLGGTLARGGMQLRGQTPPRLATALRRGPAPRAARTSSRTGRGARLLSTNGQRGAR